MNTVYRLGKGVQVRKESWGLLFYSQVNHKMCFIRSRDMLHPRHFDGTWTLDYLVREIAERLHISGEPVERSIQKILERLIEKDMVINELC